MTLTPLVNGLPAACRCRRLVAGIVDYLPVLLLVSSSHIFLWAYLLANWVWWQGERGQTIGTRLTALSVMRATPTGFRYPGWFRMTIKTAVIYVFALVFSRSFDRFPDSITVLSSVSASVLYIALVALWWIDRGRRSVMDRVLGTDVLGIPRMQPIPP